MDHSHHTHEMQQSHETHHTDGGSSHKHEAKSSGSEMCIVENRDVETYDNLTPTEIATHVWERSKPRSSFMMKKPSVSARRAQLMRLHMLSKAEPCPGKEPESASLDEKQSGSSKQNSSKRGSKVMAKCPKKQDPCSEDSNEENDPAYACPSECDPNEEEDEFEGEDDEEGNCFRY